MKKLTIALILSCALTTNLMAFSATPTGTEIAIEYDEPTTNIDESALTDLSHTTIYYNMGSGDLKLKDVPATAATGGGHIETKVILHILVDGECLVIGEKYGAPDVQAEIHIELVAEFLIQAE